MTTPQLRPATFDDYDAIHALETFHFQEHQPLDDWRRFWTDNPLWPRLADRWPIGWVLEEPGGRLVGSFCNVPSLYRFRGRDLLCANGRAWAVLPEYRGIALWLVSEYFAQTGVDLFVNTTVMPSAVPALSSFSDRVPLGDWETAPYFATSHRALAGRALEKVKLPAWSLFTWPLAAVLRLRETLLAPRLPVSPPGVDVETVTEFDARFDDFWAELVHQHPDRLLAVRDRRTLTWHYARPLRRGRLWIHTAVRAGRLRAFAVAKRQDLGEGLRRLRLVDFQTLEPEPDLLPGLLRSALRQARADGFAVLEQLGASLPGRAGFDRFAPYRRRLPSWPYYYHAPDADLATELLTPAVWDPSAYDGDASFE